MITRSLYNEMIAHARAELPNECCGLLAGLILEDRAGSDMLVLSCYPLVNESASATEYLSEPRSMFNAVRDIEGRGLEIVAVYHSHPTSEPVPSRKDLERSYSPAVANFIISLMNDKPLVRAWWFEDDSYTEASWVLVD